jgi:hypothetical protein
MMRKKKKCNTFKEAYTIKFHYTNDQKFRVISHEEIVTVDVIHGVNEGNNHDEASKIIERKYSGKKCRIIRVSCH